MAFENVNVTSLKNALMQCKNSINYETSKELINSLSNFGIWQSDSQKKLVNAIELLSTDRYNQLEKKIDDYLQVAHYIENYKSLEEENLTLNKQYASLNNKLYYNEKYTETKTTADGTKVTEEKSRRVKDNNVQSKMNSIKEQLRDNELEMNNLKNNVANLI